MRLGDTAVVKPIVAQQRASDGGDLRRLIKVHTPGAEFRRQEAEEARARSNVGHGRLALADDACQRRMKRPVAYSVGEQGAVVLDAHAHRSMGVGSSP